MTLSPANQKQRVYAAVDESRLIADSSGRCVNVNLPEDLFRVSLLHGSDMIYDELNTKEILWHYEGCNFPPFDSKLQ